MTEYWVSNKRFFCEFCKCSIADNKPIIQSHQNGKKHKENVRKRLAEMQKKATKDAREASVVENQMKKMEEAAMRAYMKDMQNNPDVTSKAIKERLEASQAELSQISQPERKEEPPEESPPSAQTAKKWMEAKSDEGYTYYWHIETGESVWEPPRDGYISLEDQKKAASTLEKSTVTSIKVKQEKQDAPKVLSVDELNRQIYRNEPRIVKQEPEEEDRDTQPVVGPSPRTDPYGSWTTIVKHENSLPDLQLPDQNQMPVFTPVYVPEERPRVFQERKAPVTSSDGEIVAFKKRKIGGGVRNARQRNTDN